MMNDELTTEDKELQALVLRLAEAALRRNQQDTIAAAAVLYDYHQHQIALAEASGAARAREEIRITIEQLERWRRDDEMERSEFGTWLYRDAVLALLRRGAGGEGNTMSERIIKALNLAAQYGGTDGAHHKTWIIDQMVRALLGCPMVERTATDYQGKQYTYQAQGENEEYLGWVRAVCDGEDGPETYSWETGVAP